METEQLSFLCQVIYKSGEKKNPDYLCYIKITILTWDAVVSEQGHFILTGLLKARNTGYLNIRCYIPLPIELVQCNNIWSIIYR